MKALRHTMTVLPVACTRLGMALCTAILLANTVDIFKFRYTTKPAAEVINATLADLPLKISEDVITQDFNRITSSRWLGVHVWPVLPWLILAYLQTSSTLRKRYLQWHRRLGRTFLIISAYMTLGHMMMFISNETILGDEEFYIDYTRPEKFFTFRAACLVFTAWWIVCMINIYRTATRGMVHVHRYWAYQFLATGFGVGAARIYIVLYYAIRFPLSGHDYLTKSGQDLIMGYALWAGFAFNCLVAHYWMSFSSSLRKDSPNLRKEE